MQSKNMFIERAHPFAVFSGLLDHVAAGNSKANCI